MAVKNKSIKQEVRTLEPLKYGEDELHVSFFKNAYTPRLEEEADRPGGLAGAVLIDMSLPLIAEWDLVDMYEVWEYRRSEKVEETYSVPPLSRRFVINGTGGKIGEWEQESVRTEYVDGTKLFWLYILEQVFQDGEPLMEERTVPITRQGLLDVPLNVMTDIIKAVGKALTPGEVKNSDSEHSFSAAA